MYSVIQQYGFPIPGKRSINFGILINGHLLATNRLEMRFQVEGGGAQSSFLMTKVEVRGGKNLNLTDFQRDFYNMGKSQGRSMPWGGESTQIDRKSVV